MEDLDARLRKMDQRVAQLEADIIDFKAFQRSMEAGLVRAMASTREVQEALSILIRPTGRHTPPSDLINSLPVQSQN